MKTLNLDLTKNIQETMTALRGSQEDKFWEIDESLETKESWNQRQSELLAKLDSLVNEATKEDLVAILTKRVFDGQYSEKSIYII